jgi:hypothetical protein
LNVASWARLDQKEEYRVRSAAWPEREKEPIDPANVSWEPQSSLEDEQDPKTPQLPNWCGSAVFFVQKAGQAVLELNIVSDPSEEWTVADETGSRSLLTAEEWRSAESPVRIELPWLDVRPPTELVVQIKGQMGDAHWPVEVRTFADLPPPQELRDLSLEQLLEILTSALPLHRCLQNLWRQNSDETSPEKVAIALDPLRRFSRDTHLLERTRRFSLAMAGMRRRLESPIPSEEYLQWRLHGPVGISKIATAILREAGSDGEKAFLLGELGFELSQIHPKSEVGFLPKKRIQDAIREMVTDFEKQAEPLLAATESSLQEYVRSAFRKARA